MTEAKTVEIPAVRCEYLAPGGSDLAAVFETEGHRAFITLDVMNGTLRTYVAGGNKPRRWSVRSTSCGGRLPRSPMTGPMRC